MSLLANQRARSATEIVDASVQFCRAHALPLLAIAAVAVIPPAILEMVVPAVFQPLVSFLDSALLALGYAVASVYGITVLTGGDASVGDAFHRIARRFFRVIGAQIVYNFAVAIGLVLLIVPGVIWGLRLALVMTIVAVEELGVSKSLDRSWALTRGHAMHVLRVLLLTLLIVLLVVMGGGAMIGLMTGALGIESAATDPLISVLVMLVMPFAWMVGVMLYVDLRVRVEGADIEAMVAELPRPASGIPVT